MANYYSTMRDKVPGEHPIGEVQKFEHIMNTVIKFLVTNYTTSHYDILVLYETFHSPPSDAPLGSGLDIWRD